MNKKPIVSAIAAIAGEKRVLGKQGKIPWNIPADAKFFKDTTVGHPVIMGRTTYLSIGKPLIGRTNIVVTRNPDFFAKGIIVVHSIDEAIEQAKKIDDKEIFVIGGGEIYKEALSKTDRLYLTVIDKEIKGDTFFPDYGQFKKVISKVPGESNGYKFQILTLER